MACCLSYTVPKIPHFYKVEFKGFEFMVLGFQFLMTLKAVMLWKLRRHKLRKRKLVGGGGWDFKNWAEKFKKK